MNFGQAIEAMREGKRVARNGWNGKGMWIYIVKDFFVEGSKQKFSPAIVMKTAGGDHQPGWLASQPDMLANDWSVAVD